jgi:hypothetical protein
VAGEPLPLGPWEPERAQLAAASVAQRGDAADLPEDVRFTANVARLINLREANASAEFDRPAAFVLVPPQKYEEVRTGRTHERLLHTGARRLTGRIHFVMAAATSSVVEEYIGGDEALFERLKALGVGETPTLVYVPQKPNSSLSYYRQGTQSDESLANIPLTSSAVTFQAIEDTLHAVYEQELATPDNTGPSKIWKDAAEGLPADLAERRVQQLIRVGLIGRFGAICSIRQEQPAKVGRTDVEVVEDRGRPPGVCIHHAVLELKVLRSRGETGSSVSENETHTHINSGVNQAHAYGHDKNTLHKMLCCFDMRDENEGDQKCFAHVQATAANLQVALRRWFLFRDSNSYRDALAALAIP